MIKEILNHRSAFHDFQVLLVELMGLIAIVWALSDLNQLIKVPEKSSAATETSELR